MRLVEKSRKGQEIGLVGGYDHGVDLTSALKFGVSESDKS